MCLSEEVELDSKSKQILEILMKSLYLVMLLCHHIILEITHV